jgi:hypothetical protein
MDSIIQRQSQTSPGLLIPFYPKIGFISDTVCGCQADADTLVFGIPGTSGGRLNTVPVLEVSLAFPKGSVVSASGLLSSSLASYQDLSSGFFRATIFRI